MITPVGAATGALLTTLFLAMPSWGNAARAEVPDAARIAADLAGPFAAREAAPELSRRGELTRRLEPMLQQQARFRMAALKPWSGDPRSLSLELSGGPDEHSLSPSAMLAFGLAVVARGQMRPSPGAPSPETCRDKAVAILRYMLPTHGAGDKTRGAAGKPWGGQWQSALWANGAGKAAWLLWDDLDPELKWLAARMICDEADRFVNTPPPARVVSDTKAEENAWNAQVIALAASMFPRHPHHTAWRAAAIRWTVSCFVTAADLERNPVVDGRPLRSWVSAPNLYEDYTLENHDRVHPDYMNAIKTTLVQRLVYEWGGMEPPEATAFNTEKVYAVLKTLAMPDAGYLYPNGQDWRLHRNADGVIVHATQAVWMHDAQAARLLRLSMETARRMMARHPDRGFYAEGEDDGPITEDYLFENMANAWLVMAAHGEGPEPVPEDRLWRDLRGLYLFEAGKFGVLRTEQSVASFSWGAQVMGMVLPFQRDLLVTPNERGLIGDVRLAGGKSDTPRVLRVERTDLPGALGICGVLERADGALEQRFGFLALPDGRALYVDTLAAKRPLAGAVDALDLGTVGILNDASWVYHTGARTLHYSGGKSIFVAAGSPEAPITLDSPWFNVDGELGIAVFRAAGEAVYAPNHTPARGRIEQLLTLNHLDIAGEPAGVAAETALVFFPAQGVEATRAATGQGHITSPPGTRRYDIKLDDGRVVTFDLGRLQIEAGSNGAARQPGSSL
jgi:hypothetical protein